MIMALQSNRGHHQCCQDRDLDRKLVRSCEFLSSKRADAVLDRSDLPSLVVGSEDRRRVDLGSIFHGRHFSVLLL